MPALKTKTEKESQRIIEESRKNLPGWRRLNPADNCSSKTYLIYTTEEGGDYQILGEWTLKEFQNLKNKRYFDLRLGDKTERIFPAFIALAKRVDSWDFILDEIKVSHIIDWRRSKRNRK